MTIRKTKTVIVGAGLSGLYAALLLEQAGYHDYLLLESRDRFGGRILSVEGETHDTRLTANKHRFDLGPSWFWPDYQPQLQHLFDALGIPYFAQHETGDMWLDQSPHQSPRRAHGYTNVPASMRPVGGMQSVIEAIQRNLDPSRILTGHTVNHIRHQGEHVVITSQQAAGSHHACHAQHVLLALPPRLVEHRITFEPALPEHLSNAWRETPTWMAPHAKYVAVYEHPFWREQGQSGEARSLHGPMGEIHDASTPEGSAGLFGFLRLPMEMRRRLSEEQLMYQCRAQLTRLFGPEAASPYQEFVKDWAVDPDTATPLDNQTSDHAETVPPHTANSGPWSGRVIGIGSEWSTRFPGYLAGAIDAASTGVEALLTHRNKRI